ncbi:MAG: glycoside hydrolase family 43 protein [Actinomycetota bacterium]|nr:glycoside hydrolase family 43 protein [Actinomycetota bacterium]
MNLYCNPIKKQGDFADPFVLRYNGKYYLYCTNPDIRCWSSDNLVDWELEGPTINSDTFPSLVPFAPEVVYWNGVFYMYTSPNGMGHYVLKSKSATGPFYAVTGNIAHCIDGSVFIDDDGKWYFYWADESGILGCEMNSPTEFGEVVNTGAYMHGWTEGPMVVKENGIYYMTYTGNHYLSKGYRINAAKSRHPLKGYKDCSCNPIIVHTEEPWVGLGHSSTVYGPDMLTRYIFYHNINPDRSRDLNIDIIILDESVHVLGPTNFPQPVPRLPDFSDNMISNKSVENWDLLKGKWEIYNGFRIAYPNFWCLSTHTLYTESGVIEFNLSVMSGEGTYGVSIGDFCIVMDTASNLVKLTGQDGTTLHECIIPYEYLHHALHCLRLRYDRDGIHLYIDGRKATEFNVPICAGGQIGYFSEGPIIEMGYTAFNSGDAKNATEELFVPVPCSVSLNEKMHKKIKLNVAQTEEYVFSVECKEVQKDRASLIVTIDGNDTEPAFIKASCDIAIYTLTLSRGLHEMSIVLSDGLHCPSTLYVHKNGKNEHIVRKIRSFGPYDKQCWGDIDLPHFKAGLNFKGRAKSEHASIGIIFRASELSDGGEGDDKRLGINFFIGYCISLEYNRVVLTRHRYDEKELLSKKINYCCADIHNLNIQIDINDIKVFINNCDAAVIEYHDPSPILFGRSGIRVKDYEIDYATFYKL